MFIYTRAYGDAGENATRMVPTMTMEMKKVIRIIIMLGTIVFFFV